VEEGALSLMRIATRGGTGNDTKSSCSFVFDCLPFDSTNRNTYSADNGAGREARDAGLVEFRVSSCSFSVVHGGGLCVWFEGLGHYRARGAVSFEVFSLVFFLSFNLAIASWHYYGAWFAKG